MCSSPGEGVDGGGGPAEQVVQVGQDAAQGQLDVLGAGVGVEGPGHAHYPHGGVLVQSAGVDDEGDGVAHVRVAVAVPAGPDGDGVGGDQLPGAAQVAVDDGAQLGGVGDVGRAAVVGHPHPDGGFADVVGVTVPGFGLQLGHARVGLAVVAGGAPVVGVVGAVHRPGEGGDGRPVDQFDVAAVDALGRPVDVQVVVAGVDGVVEPVHHPGQLVDGGEHVGAVIVGAVPLGQAGPGGAGGAVRVGGAHGERQVRPGRERDGAVRVFALVGGQADQDLHNEIRVGGAEDGAVAEQAAGQHGGIVVAGEGDHRRGFVDLVLGHAHRAFEHDDVGGGGLIPAPGHNVGDQLVDQAGLGVGAVERESQGGRGVPGPVEADTAGAGQLAEDGGVVGGRRERPAVHGQPPAAPAGRYRAGHQVRYPSFQTTWAWVTAVVPVPDMATVCQAGSGPKAGQVVFSQSILDRIGWAGSPSR